MYFAENTLRISIPWISTLPHLVFFFHEQSTMKTVADGAWKPQARRGPEDRSVLACGMA